MVAQHPAIPCHCTMRSLDFVIEEWPRLQTKWEAWADAATAADMARQVPFKSRFVANVGLPAWQIVMHVVNHATLHRGQIVGMLRQLGVVTRYSEKCRHRSRAGPLYGSPTIRSKLGAGTSNDSALYGQVLGLHDHTRIRKHWATFGGQFRDGCISDSDGAPLCITLLAGYRNELKGSA